MGYQTGLGVQLRLVFLFLFGNALCDEVLTAFILLSWSASDSAYTS